jgi:hypothetical protein
MMRLNRKAVRCAMPGRENLSGAGKGLKRIPCGNDNKKGKVEEARPEGKSRMQTQNRTACGNDNEKGRTTENKGKREVSLLTTDSQK